MNRIALIVPHFGHFQNYFKMWLQSCIHNSDIDFLLFTDNKDAISYINKCGGQILSLLKRIF